MIPTTPMVFDSLTVDTDIDKASKVAQTERKPVEATKPQLGTEKPAQSASAPVSGDCASWMKEAGITNPTAQILIGRESGCNPGAINPSSGACGIPQALPCSKMNCSLSDPVCQLRWMENYVMNRYGSWENAKAHHDANNWY